MPAHEIAVRRSLETHHGLGAWPVEPVNPFGRDANMWLVAVAFGGVVKELVIAVPGSAVSFEGTDEAIAELVEDQARRFPSEDPLASLLSRREESDGAVLLSPDG